MSVKASDRVDLAGHEGDQPMAIARAAYARDAAGYLGGFQPEDSGGLLDSMESYGVGASTAIPAFC